MPELQAAAHLRAAVPILANAVGCARRDNEPEHEAVAVAALNIVRRGLRGDVSWCMCTKGGPGPEDTPPDLTGAEGEG